MDENEIEESGKTSRRRVLQGAVGVGVGAAVYSAPIIGTVPAYAQAGTSYDDGGTSYGIWFSPAHRSFTGGTSYGDWHSCSAELDPGGTDAGQASISGSTTGGCSWRLEMLGNPGNSAGGWNNAGTSYTADGGLSGAGLNGGGVRLKLVNTGIGNLRLQILGIKDQGSCHTANTTDAAVRTWATSNSTLPITSTQSANLAYASGIVPAGTNVWYHNGASHLSPKVRTSIHFTVWFKT